MIEFIIGKIVNMRNDYVIIQNNNIGYRVFTSTYTMSKLEVGKSDQILFTQLHVREDGMSLFGFTSEEEMEMFNLLLLVSKIGPKTAIGILSTLSPNALKIAILNKKIDELCKSPGIGKKTAERIIVELRDRIDKNTIEENDDNIPVLNNELEEGIEALMSLGYVRHEIVKALKSIDTKGMSLEDIIKVGLKKLSKH